MGKTYISVKKLQLIPLGDKEELNRVYTYLKDGMYYQNTAYNILISTIYAAIKQGSSKEEIAMLYKRGSRKPKQDDPEYSLYDAEMFHFPVGLPIAGGLGHMVRADLQKATKDGLFKGNVTIPTKRRTAPLKVPKKFFSFYHSYESDEEFFEELYTTNADIYMKFVNGIVFKVVLGNPYKSRELRATFERLFTGEYECADSSIQIVDKKIIFMLTIQIPKRERKLDENKIVGVRLGVNISATCALYDPEDLDNKYVLYSGDRKSGYHVKQSITAQYQRIQKSLKYSGQNGHGRKKKMQPLERLKKKERHFIETYYHKVSKDVIDFAVKHQAKNLYLEDMKDFDCDYKLKRGWSRYLLAQYITYKADRVGIKVQKVKPITDPYKETIEFDDNKETRALYYSDAKKIALSKDLVK